MVAHVHPAARLEAFTDDGASYADERNVIVAYRLSADATAGEQPTGQNRLFAA